jgi:predicted AAA+ superfamily ATPase
VGKSTLLSKVLPTIAKYNTVKLDNPTLKNFAVNDPENFFLEYKKPLFIDEIQKAPELFNYIKNIVDEDESTGQFALTGSEKFSLMKGVEEHLSTRTGIIEMNSLSQSEINNLTNFVFKPDVNLMRERKQPPTTIDETFKKIIKGSMPDIINGRVKNLNTFYKTYTETTLVVDIKKKSVENMEKFIKFLKVLASLVGCELNYSKIADACNINRKKAIEWVDELHNLNTIFLLYPYSNNALKRVGKCPKLYFYDTGLVCYLMNYKNSTTLNNSDFSGHIFECFAISEIIKGYINNGETPSVYYLNDVVHKEKEIDLIIEGEDGILYPIEIKKNTTPQEKHFSNIGLLKPLNNKVGAMTVVCCCNDFVSFGNGKYFFPIHWI